MIWMKKRCYIFVSKRAGQGYIITGKAGKKIIHSGKKNIYSDFASIVI